jgi:oxygen-independent coproporphyrinogen-3 oxidase
MLADLINLIFDHFRFAKDYEATIEANPGTLDREKLQSLRSSGINRISIGIQSLSNEDLSFLGRIHTKEEAENAVGLSRDSGFENIGVDLIYGIPGQDINGWMENLEKALTLKPEHISAYELTVEKGTSLHENLKSGGGDKNLQLPDEDQIIDMYERSINHLTSKGYIHYEISNFAMPDRFSRHNLNYWDRGEYFGAGLGAHSFIDGKRFHNTDSLEEYLRAVSDNRSPVINSEDISGGNALSEAMFLGLRKTEGIIVEDFSRRFNKNILNYYQKEFKDLQETGLIDISASGRSNETVLKLTGKGLLVSNEIFTKFI